MRPWWRRTPTHVEVSGIVAVNKIGDRTLWRLLVVGPKLCGCKVDRTNLKVLDNSRYITCCCCLCEESLLAAVSANCCERIGQIAIFGIQTVNHNWVGIGAGVEHAVTLDGVVVCYLDIVKVCVLWSGPVEHHFARLLAVNGDSRLVDVHPRCCLVVIRAWCYGANKSYSHKHFYNCLFHHCVFLFVTMLFFY